MTSRRRCPPAPGPLEDYVQRFDSLFSSLAQRRGFRDYLQGLLLPRDRNKTLTGLAGAEPVAGAQHREVQRLQWFLSESAWDHKQVNERRGQAFWGGAGPPPPRPGGERDPGFKTKPQLAVELVQAAQQAGIAFQAVVADCFYGDNPGFTQALTAAKIPFVLALKPRKGTWAPAEQAHTPVEAAGELGWGSPNRPGQWRRIQRRFRDGHTETWWAADAQPCGWGPDRRLRLVVATTDPARLPGHSSWYLLTNLPRPDSRRAQQANLAEVVRLYGLRNWV